MSDEFNIYSMTARDQTGLTKRRGVLRLALRCNYSQYRLQTGEIMTLYKEVHRPRFHFTAKENWHNDPNGLVYHQGLWHLFFQHNPNATVWGNMTWGHAVSSDLIHWRQLEHALYPDKMGTMYSGSAVVDWENSAGFGAGSLLAFYTAAGAHVSPKQPYTQCLAYSQDGGETWHKYNQNPVVDCIEGANRDPKVIWHGPSRHWIMALYLAEDRYCLLRSEDAKVWEKVQDIQLPGDTECPDFFPLLDASGRERWVLLGASGMYLIGDFDGTHFHPTTTPQCFEFGANGYASQTYSDSPDGRRIQLSWMKGGRYPEMPFNQQMSFPVVLGLKGTGNTIAITRQPIEEIKTLRSRSTTADQTRLNPTDELCPDVQGTLFDLQFTITGMTQGRFDVWIRGHRITCTKRAGSAALLRLGTRELPLTLQRSRVRLLVDRTSIEVFIDDGVVSASHCFLPGAYESPILFRGREGRVELTEVIVHELKSTWVD